MNWLVFIVTFAIAVMIGSFLAGRLERSRPEWGPRRRKWTAALALPAFTVLLAIGAVSVTMVTIPAADYRDLYSAVYAIMGAIFFVIALIGGLVGAGAVVRKTRA